MKEYLKPVNLLFYFLTAFVFLFLGFIAAALMDAGKNQGLAGGAIVLGYGVMFAFIAFFVAIAMVGFVKKNIIVLLTKILAILFIVLVAFFFYRYQTKSDEIPNPEQKKPVTKPVSYNTVAPDYQMQEQTHMGLGMCTPDFLKNPVIYFYSNPDLQKSIGEHTPFGSLVFRNTGAGPEISYAPPWFVPAHLKLDYGILFLRVVAVNREFLEVVVNETNGQTFFIDRFKNRFDYWPDFLLTINSVEPIYPQDNPVRIKPLRHASIVSSDYAFLKPLRITNEWIEVKLMDDKFKELASGWIRWRESGKLLISYSLLS